MNLLKVDYHKEEVYGVEEEFLAGVPATGVASSNGMEAIYAAGTIATGDTRAGRATITHNAGANDEKSYSTTNEVFEFVAGKPIRFRAMTQPGATTPEEVNCFIGLMEGLDSAAMVDAGAGPKADTDGFGFFCVETGGAVYSQNWHVWSSFNTAFQVTELVAANCNNLLNETIIKGEILRDFEAEWVSTNDVPGVGGAASTLLDAEVRFYVGGILAAKHVQNGVNVITTASTEEMDFGLYTLNTAGASTWFIDYLKCEQLR